MKTVFRTWLLVFLSFSLSLLAAILFGQNSFQLAERTLLSKVLILTSLTGIFSPYLYQLISKIVVHNNFSLVFPDEQIKIISWSRKFLNWCLREIYTIWFNLNAYIKQNFHVVIGLGIIVLVAYGFEMFNFNLTVDEEIYAIKMISDKLWIGEGRWGMYILNKLLLPYSIVPVIPLFIGLVFQIIGILLILKSWKVHSKVEQMISGAIILTFPTLAYIYMFSTINFGIGIGFFFVGLSIYYYAKNNGFWRLVAIFPAVFALGIYQPFFLVLVSVFLVYLILEIKRDGIFFENSWFITLVHLGSIMVYYLIQTIFLNGLGVEKRAYITNYFDHDYLRNNLFLVLSEGWNVLKNYYSGYERIYGIEISALSLFISISFMGIFINILENDLSIPKRIIIIIFSLLLLVIPFSNLLLSGGVALSRSLIALPVAVGGIFILGLLKKPDIARLLALLLAGICVFQFCVSTNRLFGSSSLSLQADRLIATRLMEKIDQAKVLSDKQNPVFIEVVGRLPRQNSYSISRINTIGLSFFELDPSRIAAFLEISGYQNLQPLPDNRRMEMVTTAKLMPVWPADGCVQIIEDTVLIKLDDYYPQQVLQICSAMTTQTPGDILPEDFCR